MNKMAKEEQKGELEERLKEIVKKKDDRLSRSHWLREEPAEKQEADLAKIINVYETILADEESSEYYSLANGLLTDKETIYKFVDHVKKYELSHKLLRSIGGFLSGLINNLEEKEEITIDLSKFGYLDDLGYRLNSQNVKIIGNSRLNLGFYMNSGKLTLVGNAFNQAGLNMHGGELIIKGNVTYNLGEFMEDGKIILEGNAGEDVGGYMYGGIIIVNGNAGKHVGSHMKGGEIHLNGDYESLSNKIEGGKIYHKGELILEKDSPEKNYPIHKKVKKSYTGFFYKAAAVIALAGAAAYGIHDYIELRRQNQKQAEMLREIEKRLKEKTRIFNDMADIFKEK